MATLTHQQIRDQIRSLCDMWDADAHTDYAGREGLDEATVVGLHTTAHHATRMARALLLVDAQLDGIETVLIARSILESAITAGWLLLTPDAARLIIREGAQKRKAAIDELINQGHEDTGPGYQQALDVLAQFETEGLEGGSHLQQRSRAFTGGDQLYSIYRALSGRSHPGVGVMDFYVVENPDTEIGMTFNPGAQNDAKHATLAVAAISLVLTLYADELARNKPHRTTQLRKAARRLETRLEFTRPDGTTLSDRT